MDRVTGEGIPLEGTEGPVPVLGRAPDAGESCNIPGANMAEQRERGRADAEKLDCGRSLNLVKYPGLHQNVKM